MSVLKLSSWGWAFLVMFLSAPRSSLLAEDAVSARAPVVSEVRREFLSRLARRTLRDAVLGRETYQRDYVPAALGSVYAEVVVRLRQRGYLLAAGAGATKPIAESTRDAALAAATTWIRDLHPDVEAVDQILVEIEACGAAEPLPAGVDWTQPGAVDADVEPGVHGLVLSSANVQYRLCPSEVFTGDTPLSDALKALAQNLHTDPSQVTQTRLWRFRASHWYEPAPGAGVVSLHRGLTLVAPEAVSARGLDEAVAGIAEYMVYRQLGSGLFTYQFDPGQDRYSDEDNVVRQVGAAAAMALHARRSQKSASLAAADLAIRRHLQGLTEIPGVEGAGFIATADGKNKLGVTALLCVALQWHPDPERYAAAREKLIRGMLRLQRPSGMFVTAFPPAVQITAQDYFPGEALLALAMEYDRQPSAKILEAFDRAIGFYRDYFRAGGSPAFVPWQVQAFTLMAGHSKRRDYIDFVFELTDWLAERQLTPSNCEWSELRGGIAAQQPGRPGVATASYLEGFADALTLARRIGDAERAKRYERLVREAARFVMQLQVRPEEAYFTRSPQDVVGGIRTAPALHRLRIDHCQHALVAMMKTRAVLYPDEP